SVYNLDEADTTALPRLFALYEAEAQRLLSRGLALPAYGYVLKTSHVFNVLDARGAVGVAERARYFARMRDLARQAARGGLARPRDRGSPLGRCDSETAPPDRLAGAPTPVPAGRAEDGVHRAAPPPPADFVLEIGSEELPAADVDAAVASLAQR